MIARAKGLGRAQASYGNITVLSHLKCFSGHISSSVMAAFAYFILSSFNCYCWTSITISGIHPSITSTEHKGWNPDTTRSHVALIAQLVEHCTGNAKVVYSNPVQSLNFFFQVIFPEVLWLHLHISCFHLELTLHI